MDGALLHWESEDPLPAGQAQGDPVLPEAWPAQGGAGGASGPGRQSSRPARAQSSVNVQARGPPRAGGCGEAAEVCTFPSLQWAPAQRALPRPEPAMMSAETPGPPPTSARALPCPAPAPTPGPAQASRRTPHPPGSRGAQRNAALLAATPCPRWASAAVCRDGRVAGV